MPAIVKAWPPGPCVEDENGFSILRRWTVLSTSELAARNYLRAAAGVYRGAPFREDNGSIPTPYAICQRLTVTAKRPAPLGGFGLYEIDAEFSTQQGLQRAVPGGPAVFTIKNTLTSLSVDLDGQGNAILTSAEEPLDPPLTAFKPNEIIHVEFYVQAPDAIIAYAPLRRYNGALNAGTFFGATRGCILSHVFTPQASDTGWVLVQGDFEYRKPKVINGKTYEGWHDVFPDRGFREVINPRAKDQSRYENILDPKTSLPVETPVPLDGKGRAADLASKDPKKAAAIIDVNNYTYMNFNTIPGMRFK